jgi:hypothetical protein
MTGIVNPVRVRFDAPTRYVDGSPIPANGILRYEYGISQNAAGPFTPSIQDSNFTPDGDGKQEHPLVLEGLAFGQWYVAGRAVSRDNQVSAWTSAIPFEVRAKVPEPPQNFIVA